MIGVVLLLPLCDVSNVLRSKSWTWFDKGTGRGHVFSVLCGNEINLIWMVSWLILTCVRVYGDVWEGGVGEISRRHSSHAWGSDTPIPWPLLHTTPAILLKATWALRGTSLLSAPLLPCQSQNNLQICQRWCLRNHHCAFPTCQMLCPPQPHVSSTLTAHFTQQTLMSKLSGPHLGKLHSSGETMACQPSHSLDPLPFYHMNRETAVKRF